MSSYGEPSSYGRARPPAGDAHGQPPAADPYEGHDAYSGYADSYAVDSYGVDPYPVDPYRADAYPEQPAQVGVGAVAGARAAAAPQSPAGHRYDWSSGPRSAPGSPSGRATVPVSPSPGEPGTGPAGGRPSGRASVPVAGGPQGPGGPPVSPAAGGAGGAGDGRPPVRPKKKRHWVRNSLISVLAVVVMLMGGVMVALSYYVDDVRPPDQLDLDQASRVYSSDGEEMAVLQDENRQIIDTTDLTVVQEAVVAAEDQKFWEHSGVDFLGIARAAWNNFTGGEIQGASTITQQYARIAGELHGQTYSRKLEEAAMAYKLTQEYSREQILDFYLNTVYFGRGAHGIEAAAKAYFGVPAAELTPGQAAMLAGIIRYPDDGSGLSKYDPHNSPDDDSVAESRWRWVIDQMVETGASSLEGVDPAQLELPEVIEPTSVEPWHEGPQGPVVSQVMDELEAMGITDISTGGYRITTTIDPDIQEAALRAAYRGYDEDSAVWQGYPDNLDAAIVAIDPATGAVRGYFGGTDGTGFDMADWNWNEEQEAWVGGRAPGSSFKIYTLIAMMRESLSVESHWKTTPYEADWMDGRVRNAGRGAAGSCTGQAPDYCTLRWSTEQSYNVPFAYFSQRVSNKGGPALIADAARDAGIMRMKDTITGSVHDLVGVDDMREVAPEHFMHPIAYGGYPVSVLDHASGVATLAARGVYHEPHFVETVEKRDEETGEWEEIAGGRIKGDQRIEQQYVDVITDVLKAVPGINDAGLAGGRPAAAKTGTWEFDGGPDDPRTGTLDAWVVGYTPQVAAAVWTGDGSDDPDPALDRWGGSLGSSELPAEIWQQFMNEAHAAKEYPVENFPQAPQIGQEQHQLANGERQQRDDDDDDDDDDGDCPVPFLCPPDDEGNDNGNGNGNGDSDSNGGGGGGVGSREDGDLVDPSAGR